jgi:hypothetical protein
MRLHCEHFPDRPSSSGERTWQRQRSHETRRLSTGMAHRTSRTHSPKSIEVTDRAVYCVGIAACDGLMALAV